MFRRCFPYKVHCLSGRSASPSPSETTVVDVAVVHCTSDARTRIGTAAGHLHGRVRMAAAEAMSCGKRDRLDRHMAAAVPVGAPAGTRFLAERLR